MVEDLHRTEVDHYVLYIGGIMVQKDCKIEVGNKKKKDVVFENDEINEDENLVETKEIYYGYVDDDMEIEVHHQNYYIENVEIEKEVSNENYQKEVVHQVKEEILNGMVDSIVDQVVFVDKNVMAEIDLMHFEEVYVIHKENIKEEEVQNIKNEVIV